MRKSPIIAEIDKFVLARNVYSTTKNYSQYLYDFVKITGIQDSSLIRDEDIDSYISALKAVTSSDYRRLEAITAINLFRKFVNTKHRKENTVIRSVGRPPKTSRNEKMFMLREEDPSQWTYRTLGKRFRITERAAWEVVKRMENKHKMGK